MLIVVVLELPKQEDIAIVLISGRLPVLMERHAVEVGLGRMADHLDGIEGDFDELVSAERILKRLQVLFLGLPIIYDLRLQRRLVVLYRTPLDYPARDDQGIVAIHLAE